MSTRFTRGAHLLTGIVTVLLAIPLFGLLIWGAWRLLFWGVVASAPHAHYGPAAGMATPDAMPPGVDTMLTGGVVSGPGGSVALLVGLLALACLLLLVVAAERTTEPPAALEEA